MPLAQIWYNSSHHTSLCCSPAKALYGTDPNLGGYPLTTQDTLVEVAQVIKHRAEHLELLKQHLLQAQNRMKMQADKHRLDKEFSVGDQVLLKLQPYTQSSVANRPYLKLAFKYYGPYRVLEKIGDVAYKLELPSHSDIHPDFHISQLKPFTPNYSPVYLTMPTVTDLQATDAELATILQRRLVRKGSAAVPQVQVSWTGLLESVVTWEDYNVLKDRFPSAAAWGPAGSSAGGDVTTHG